MTAPFLIRTPKNVTTRTRTRKSNPAKLVSITEGTGIKPHSEDQDDSMKIPTSNEMFLLNTQCEKSILESKYGVLGTIMMQWLLGGTVAGPM